MEGDEVLHNGLHSSACSLDPDNEVSTLTDTIDVLITTGNIHATPRSPPTCHKILFISVYRWFSGVPKFGADRSAWGRFIGVHLYFIGVLL